ncbi:hypothetical protein TWF281_009114 [Arthrobotrys megalospora]
MAPQPNTPPASCPSTQDDSTSCTPKGDFNSDSVDAITPSSTGPECVDSIAAAASEIDKGDDEVVQGQLAQKAEVSSPENSAELVAPTSSAVPEDSTQSHSDPNSESSCDSDDEDEDILHHLKTLNSNHLTQFGDSIVRPNNINVTFNDIYITPDAIQALDPLVLQIHFPEQFRTGVLAQNACTGLLLYGPPGTGKTLFVKALAKMANATILSLTGADLQDCRVGESEKKIQRIFSSARAHDGPVVIFIDEADGPFRSRSKDNNTQSHTTNVGQFLIEMDGVNSNGLLNIMIIAAANRPFDMDEGILRRFGRRILVDTPTRQGRECILKIHLRDEMLSEDVDLKDLSRRTADFTGSDLKNLVYEATLAAVRDICRVPRNEEDAVFTRVICHRHFLHALELVHPSPKSDTVDKIHQFHSKFGNKSQRRPHEESEKYQMPLKKRRLDTQNE